MYALSDKSLLREEKHFRISLDRRIALRTAKDIVDIKFKMVINHNTQVFDRVHAPMEDDILPHCNINIT